MTGEARDLLPVLILPIIYKKTEKEKLETACHTLYNRCSVHPQKTLRDTRTHRSFFSSPTLFSTRSIQLNHTISRVNKKVWFYTEIWSLSVKCIVNAFLIHCSRHSVLQLISCDDSLWREGTPGILFKFELFSRNTISRERHFMTLYSFQIDIIGNW